MESFLTDKIFFSVLFSSFKIVQMMELNLIFAMMKIWYFYVNEVCMVHISGLVSTACHHPLLSWPQPQQRPAMQRGTLAFGRTFWSILWLPCPVKVNLAAEKKKNSFPRILSDLNMHQQALITFQLIGIQGQKLEGKKLAVVKDKARFTCKTCMYITSK